MKIEVKQIDWFDDRFYKIRYENEAKVEVEEYFPSVTTKLGAVDKPFLRKWYGDLGTREALERMKEAADRGSRIHWAWYTYTTGGAVVYDPWRTPLYTKEEMEALYKRYNNQVVVLKEQNEMNDMVKLEKFYKALNPLECMSEITVYNLEHKEAGTADNIIKVKGGEYLINGKNPLELEGGYYVVDLKTGNQVSNEHKMQISAYVNCIKSMDWEEEMEIKGALIVHTSASMKNGIEGLKTHFLSIDEIDSYYERYRLIAEVWRREFGSLKPTIRQIPGIISIGVDHGA